MRSYCCGLILVFMCAVRIAIVSMVFNFFIVIKEKKRKIETELLVNETVGIAISRNSSAPVTVSKVN